MQRRRGQGATEYVLLVAGLAVALVVGVKFLGTAIGGGFTTMSGAVDVVSEGIGAENGGRALPTGPSGAPTQRGQGRSRRCLQGHDYVSAGPGKPEVCRDCGQARGKS